MHRVQYAAALGVCLTGGAGPHNGGNCAKALTGFLIQYGVCASSRVNGEEPVSRHACDLVGEHACAVYDELGAYRSPVCLNGHYLTVFDLHAGDCGVERHSCAVVHRILGIGDDEIIRTYAAGRGVGQCKGDILVYLRLFFTQLVAHDYAGIFNAVIESSPHGVQPHGNKPAFFAEAGVLPRAPEGNIKL